MSFGALTVGGAAAVAALLAVSSQADLAYSSDNIGASGTPAWAQADDRGLTEAAPGEGSIPEGPRGDTFLDVAYSDVRGLLLFNFAITDAGPVVYAASDTMTDAPGLSSGIDGTLTTTAAPELTTWATLALVMAPLGAAARLRRRWVAHATAV
jgi:hypothetical protein